MMNKCFMVIWIVVLTCVNVWGQKENYRIDLDTLEVFDNRILAYYRILKKESLLKESVAYLCPVTHTIPRFKITGSLIKKDIELDSIVRHGTTKKYYDGRVIQVIEFIDGKEISSTYYNHNGIEISKQEYLNTYNLCGPDYSLSLGEYLVTGQKESGKKLNRKRN